MKMVQTKIRDGRDGWIALAECPICGAMVYLGTTPHRDEACIELPVQELVDICSSKVNHSPAQKLKHGQALLAWEFADIPPEDYL